MLYTGFAGLSGYSLRRGGGGRDTLEKMTGGKTPNTLALDRQNQVIDGESREGF